MLAEDFEDQVEELHERYPDGDIDRNLQPAPRLLSPTQQVGDILRGLLQSVRQLLKVLQRSPHLVRSPRQGQRGFTELLSIAQIKFSPARGPPRTPGRTVIHPLPNLHIRILAQHLC